MTKSTLPIVAIAAIATSLLLGACVTLPAAGEATRTTAGEDAPVEAGAIPVEALRNASYSGIYDEPSR